MKKHIATSSMILFGVALTAFAETGEWTNLLDPKLSYWELWMGVPHESVKDLQPGTPTSAGRHIGKPLGLNHDPKHVYYVLTEDGQPVLKVTGEIYGGAVTRQEYGDYHFTCQINTRLKDGTPLSAGKIQLQCEGAEVYYRDVRIQPITEFPTEILNASGLSAPAPAKSK